MHTPVLLSSLVFPPMDENLHNIRPHQTAHPSLCAKKWKEVRFSVMAINQVLRALGLAVCGARLVRDACAHGRVHGSVATLS